jgi:hypothetical protein
MNIEEENAKIDAMERRHVKLFWIVFVAYLIFTIFKLGGWNE